MGDYVILTSEPKVKQEHWREDDMNYTVATGIIKIRCRWKPVVEVKTFQLRKGVDVSEMYEGNFKKFVAVKKLQAGVPVGAIFTERMEESMEYKHLLVMAWSWYKVTL